jgi:hypothetical protein
VSPIDTRDAGKIEHDVTTFAQGSNGGLIVAAAALTVVHRDLIVALAARHRLLAQTLVGLLLRSKMERSSMIF